MDPLEISEVPLDIFIPFDIDGYNQNKRKLYGQGICMEKVNFTEVGRRYGGSESD